MMHLVHQQHLSAIGDRLIYLLYDPKPKLLKLLSGPSQLRLTLEELPEVEEIPMLKPVLSVAIEAVPGFVAGVADGQ